MFSHFWIFAFFSPQSSSLLICPGNYFCHIMLLTIQIFLVFIGILNPSSLLDTKPQDYWGAFIFRRVLCECWRPGCSEALSFGTPCLCGSSAFDQFDYLVFYFLPPSTKILRVIPITHTIWKKYINVYHRTDYFQMVYKHPEHRQSRSSGVVRRGTSGHRIFLSFPQHPVQI